MGTVRLNSSSGTHPWPGNHLSRRSRISRIRGGMRKAVVSKVPEAQVCVVCRNCSFLTWTESPWVASGASYGHREVDLVEGNASLPLRHPLRWFRSRRRTEPLTSQKVQNPWCRNSWLWVIGYSLSCRPRDYGALGLRRTVRLISSSGTHPCP